MWQEHNHGAHSRTEIFWIRIWEEPKILQLCFQELQPHAFKIRCNTATLLRRGGSACGGVQAGVVEVGGGARRNERPDPDCGQGPHGGPLPAVPKSSVAGASDGPAASHAATPELRRGDGPAARGETGRQLAR
jgi:hypothetical protein